MFIPALDTTARKWKQPSFLQRQKNIRSAGLVDLGFFLVSVEGHTERTGESVCFLSQQEGRLSRCISSCIEGGTPGVYKCISLEGDHFPCYSIFRYIKFPLTLWLPAVLFKLLQRIFFPIARGLWPCLGKWSSCCLHLKRVRGGHCIFIPASVGLQTLGAPTICIRKELTGHGPCHVCQRMLTLLMSHWYLGRRLMSLCIPFLLLI